MRATIISIYPYPIVKENPSIVPPELVIPACQDEGYPVFVHIDDVKTWEYIPLQPRGRPRGRFNQVDGFLYAKNTVSDFLHQIFHGSFSEGIHPGLGVVENFVKDCPPSLLKHMQECQLKWKDKLIAEADDLWDRWRQRKFITNIQISLARKMNLNREWASELAAEVRAECPACFEKINPLAVVCRSCRTILDEERYAKFKRVGEGVKS